MNQHGGDTAEKLCTKKCLTVKKKHFWKVVTFNSFQLKNTNTLENVCISTIVEVTIESKGAHIHFPKDDRLFDNFLDFFQTILQSSNYDHVDFISLNIPNVWIVSILIHSPLDNTYSKKPPSKQIYILQMKFSWLIILVEMGASKQGQMRRLSSEYFHVYGFLR